MSTKLTTDIPALMQDALLRLADVNKVLITAKIDFESREAVLFKEIIFKSDLLGKPAYPNDTSKINALVIAKSSDVILKEFQDNVHQKELEKAKILAEIEVLKMNFQLHLFDRELEIALVQKGCYQ